MSPLAHMDWDWHNSTKNINILRKDGAFDSGAICTVHQMPWKLFILLIREKLLPVPNFLRNLLQAYVCLSFFLSFPGYFVKFINKASLPTHSLPLPSSPFTAKNSLKQIELAHERHLTTKIETKLFHRGTDRCDFLYLFWWISLLILITLAFLIFQQLPAYSNWI